MSYEYKRRGKNWHTAMGLLFIVSGMIVLVRQILIWTPDFVFDFLVNSEFTNEKVSVAVILATVLVPRAECKRGILIVCQDGIPTKVLLVF